MERLISQCSYCSNHAVQQFSYYGYTAKARGAYTPLIKTYACDVHKDCVNFRSVLVGHPDGVLTHLNSVPKPPSKSSGVTSTIP